MKILYATDMYKTGHINQYPEGTTEVYSTFTPRSNKYAPKGVYEVVVFGIQGFIKKWLIDGFNEFFNSPIEEIEKYEKVVGTALNIEYNADHFRELHKLGYLPIEIKALEEGTLAPMRIPVLTVKNTHPDFAWLTNYIETLMSAELWQPMTSASIARQYRKNFEEYADITGANKDFIDWQGHDFSFRGMSSLASAELSGAAHLLSFLGTDTIPAITYLQEYYTGGDFVGGSVAATEHSVMCAGGNDNEFETIKRLINEVYPSGIVSIVSDTWDFWGALENIYKPLKEDILARDGRVVIRPDSGNPVEIICGLSHLDGVSEFVDAPSAIEYKGAFEWLWDNFGGTINDKGYKVLNEKIGLIYGDSITLERQEEILRLLERKGFSADNLVLGIGSFTYQYNTRDTFGFAMKATNVVINGKSTPIFKDPKTDDGTKKSAKGYVEVINYINQENNNTIELKLLDELQNDIGAGLLRAVFKDGKLIKEVSLEEIRMRLK